MVHRVDVVVQVPTGTVDVSDHEEVGAVHPASELYTEVMHTLDVLRVFHVELLRREILCVRVHLVPATERSAHLLCTRDDRLG